MRSLATLVRPAQRGGRAAAEQIDRTRVWTHNELLRRSELRHGSAPSSSSSSSSSTRTAIRQLHGSGSKRKPPESQSVYSFDAAVAEGRTQGYMLDPAQILADWRLLERQASLSQGKGKARALDDDAVQAEHDGRSSTTTFDPDFFSPHTKPLSSASATSLHVQVPPLPPSHVSATVVTPATPDYIPLWSSTLDGGLVDRLVLKSMERVQSGNRDLHALAAQMLASIVSVVPSEQTECELTRDRRLEELRLLLLSYWVGAASRKLRSRKDTHSASLLLISITEALYRSTHRVAMSAVGALHCENILAIQRATLHRLFGFMYECSRKSNAVSSQVCARALTACCTIARDDRLKPSQARYLLRKLLSRLRQRFDEDDLPANFIPLWSEMTMTLMKLLENRRVLPLRAKGDGGAGKGDYNHMANFLVLLSSAIRDGKVSSDLAHTALLPLVNQIVSINQHSASEVMPVSFVESAEQLDEVVSNLVHQSKHKVALHLYVKSPTSLRTFRTTCRLMRRWSNVPLDFDDSFEKHRSCSDLNSSRLLRDATTRMDWSNTTNLPGQLRRLAHARFVSHCNRRDPGAVIKDLTKLGQIWPGGGQLTRSAVLSQLGNEAQVQAVHTFAMSGHWARARRLASKIIAITTDKAVEAHDPARLRTRLANTLLHATLYHKWQRSSTGLRTCLRRADDRPGLRTARSWPHTKDRSTMLSGVDRMTQARRGMGFLERFCAKTGATPDQHTSLILLNSLARCRPHALPDTALLALARDLDWDWQTKGVGGVLSEVRGILSGHPVPTSTANKTLTVPPSDPSRDRKALFAVARRAEIAQKGLRRRNGMRPFRQAM